jgi:DNA/RNA endonuclease YhcR with UshA esterase domain
MLENGNPSILTHALKCEVSVFDMKNSLKISLVISILGIFLLLILSNILPPPKLTIEKIDDSFLNKKVQVNGTIFNIKNYKDSNFCVVSIKDQTGKIDVTASKILDLKNNQAIEVTGKVTEYKKYLQIQADKIKILK